MLLSRLRDEECVDLRLLESSEQAGWSVEQSGQAHQIRAEKQASSEPSCPQPQKHSSCLARGEGCEIEPFPLSVLQVGESLRYFLCGPGRNPS